MITCRVEHCSQRAGSDGLCKKHRERVRRHGSTDEKRRGRPRFYTFQVGLRLDDGQHKAVQAFAKANNLTVMDAIRVLIEAGLEK